MKELNENQIEEVSGGLVFLAPLLFAPTTVSFGGVATAMGIGGGIGAIAGGLIAIYSDE